MMSNRSKTRLSENEFAQEHIAPSHHVVCPGTHAEVEWNPLPAWLSLYLNKEKGGKLTLVEPKIANPTTRRKMKERVVKKETQKELEFERDQMETGGQGGIDAYMKSWRKWRKIQGGKTTITPKVVRARIETAKIPSQSADVVYDRFTSYFALNGYIVKRTGDTGRSLNIKERWNKVNQIADAYTSWIKRGGKIIMTFESNARDANEFREAFRKKGMHVEEHPLSGEFRIKKRIFPYSYAMNHAIIVTHPHG